MILNMLAKGSGGGGGGYSLTDIATNTAPSGSIMLDSSITSLPDYALAGKPITSIYGSNITSIGNYALQNTQITSITDSDFPSLGASVDYTILLSISSLTSIKLSGEHIVLNSGSGSLRGCPNLVTAEFPNANKSISSQNKVLGQQSFYGNSNLTTVDAGYVASLGAMAFYNCSKLNTLILRKTSPVSLASTNTLSGTRFKSGGAGGTIYIPKSLYDHLGDGTANDYKAATNWSTYDGYGTITWAKIEGSIYE